MATALPLRHRLHRSSLEQGIALPFDQIWIDAAVVDHPLALDIVNRLPGVPVDVVEGIDHLKRPRDIEKARRQLVLTTFRGQPLKKKSQTGKQITASTLCPLELLSGGPMTSSWGLSFVHPEAPPLTTIAVNLEAVFHDIKTFLTRHHDQRFIVRVGATADDGLALDGLTGQSRFLIPFFASKQNACLELITTTGDVTALLPLTHRGRTILSWRIATDNIIAEEERGTAQLKDRLQAAAKTANAGYRIGLHIDPIVLVEGSDEEINRYTELVDRVFSVIEPRSVAWLSLRHFSCPVKRKNQILTSFPHTKIFSGEMVPTDGTYRFPRFLREKVYTALWKRLTSYVPPHKIILADEPAAVWEKIDPSVRDNTDLERRLLSYFDSPRG